MKPRPHFTLSLLVLVPESLSHCAWYETIDSQLELILLPRGPSAMLGDSGCPSWVEGATSIYWIGAMDPITHAAMHRAATLPYKQEFFSLKCQKC